MVPHTKIQKLGGDYRVEHESTTVCSLVRIKVRQGFKVSPFLSSHLQNEVSGEQPIGPSGRTVVIHALYVNTPQVPSAERDSHLHPGPAYHHQPRLAHLPDALRRHPAEQQAGGGGSEGRRAGASHYRSVGSAAHLNRLRGLVVGVVCLEEGVSVPSSCSLRVSMAE